MSVILKNKKVVIGAISIFLILLIAPIFIFILNFKSNLISNDVSDWASFGDYFGGTLNTIISLSSLIILSYLTYLLSEQSNSENKKNNILMRRMDAYGELTSFFPQVNQLLFDFTTSTGRLAKKLDEKPLDIESIRKEKLELNKNIRLFMSFHSFLFFLNLRFGHLFDYNFNSEKYKKILDDAKILNDLFESTGFFFEGEIQQPNIEGINLIPIFFDELTEFVNSIRQELI